MTGSSASSGTTGSSPGSGLTLERIEPWRLDHETAAEMAVVTRAEVALDMPSAVPMTGEGLLLQARHGFDDSPTEALWLVRADDGSLLGHASLETTRWDNPRLAMVFCRVRPDARGAGVGTVLLNAQIAAARDLRRSLLLTFAVEDSAPARYLVEQGFSVGQLTAQRRLSLRQLDYPAIESLAAAVAAGAGDYELVRLDGPAPADLLPGLVTLFEAINDAPDDDLDHEPDRYPVERARAYDAAMAARRQHVYRVLARDRRTGDWAGHTILCVDETRPGYAVQEDTSVLPPHRGHRLGMWLKTSMLLWMQEARPELTTIDTWNARSNAHMIAVNDALGCSVSTYGVALQRAV